MWVLGGNQKKKFLMWEKKKKREKKLIALGMSLCSWCVDSLLVLAWWDDIHARTDRRTRHISFDDEIIKTKKKKKKKREMKMRGKPVRSTI